MLKNRSVVHYTRSLIEASLDPMVTISADGKIMDVNSATENVTGVPRDKLIGSDFSEYFTEPDKARAGYQQVFSQGYVTDYPLAIRHVSGHVTDVLYNATVYRDEQGEIAGVFAAARDVTERQRAEEQLRAASHYSRSLIEASLDPLVTISADGKIMDVNTATEKITGVSRDRLIGSDFSEYFTEPDKARAGYQLVFSQGYVTDYPLAIRHASGSTTDVLYNASVYRDEFGKVAGVFAAARDITTLKRSQQELENTNREILALGQMTDLLQSCQSAEESFPIIRATMLQLFPESSGACFIQNESSNLLEEVTSWGDTPPKETVFAPDECWALRRGHMHTVEAGQVLNPRCKHLQQETSPYMCVPMMAQGKALGIIYLSPDDFASGGNIQRRQRLAETTADSISLALANLKLRESLRALSIRDPLTGLFNRRFMEETLERELSRMARMKKQLVIAMLDIDKFKNFNDSYGHDAGDALLKEFALQMLRFRHGSDVACRFGGEEFILILPEISTELAMERLELLRRSFGEFNLNFHGQTLPPVTASIGVAIFPRHGSTGETLLKAADDALYRAKHSGRNRIVMTDESPAQDTPTAQ